MDLLVPARPLGATTLSILLMVGGTAVATRFVGPGRLRAFTAVFVLSWPFHLLLLTVLMAAEGVTLRTFEPRLVLVAAVLNTILALPLAVAFAAIGRRFREAERAEW